MRVDILLSKKIISSSKIGGIGRLKVIVSDCWKEFFNTENPKITKWKRRQIKMKISDTLLMSLFIFLSFVTSENWCFADSQQSRKIDSKIHFEEQGRFTDFHIETCTLNHDLKNVAEVINVVYKQHPILTQNRTSLEQLQLLVSNPNSRLYILFSPTKDICGTVSITHDKEQTELSLFSIHPDYQRQNLGSYLLKHSENMAHNLFQSHEMILLTLEGKLVDYYQKSGYELINKITFPYPEIIAPELREKEVFCIMTKKLDNPNICHLNPTKI